MQNTVDVLLAGDTEEFRRLLISFLSSIPYTMRRKENERECYFHYTFYLLMRLVSVYTVYAEKQRSEGHVDCVVEIDNHVYIFEFKLDGTADEALRQIEEKGYWTIAATCTVSESVSLRTREPWTTGKR